MLKRQCTQIALVSILLFGASPSAASCMSSSATKNIAAQDLSWIKSDKPIYAIDDTGLYATTLNSTAIKRLVTLDKAKDYIDNRSLSISADGKYIYFKQGKVGNERAIEAYIYDVGADKLTKIPRFIHEHFRYNFIGFSPDNQYLAWLQDGTSFDSRTPDSLPSIYVYSVEKNQIMNFDYPAPHAQPGKIATCFKPQWSEDSKSIYSNFLESGCSLPEVDEQKVTYFKLDVATGTMLIIAGSYETITKNGSTGKYKIQYRDENKRIPYRARCDSSSKHCDIIYGEPYIEKQSRAYFEEDGLIWKGMNLYVQVAAGKPVKVQSGTYSQCSGSSIRIEGWIEDGKYLIYTLDRVPYIYAVEKNRSAPLTHLPHPFGKFIWAPEHSARFAFPIGRSQSDDGNRVLHSIFFWGD